MTSGMPSGYSIARRPGPEPVRHRRDARRARRRQRRRRGRRPGGDHGRHRDLRLDRQPRPRRRATSACGPTVGLVSRDRHRCRSAPPRTPPARSPGPSPTPPPSCRRSPARTRRTPRPTRAPATVPNYLAGLTATALNGKRIGVINNTNAQYQAAIAAIQALGATTVQIPTPSPAQNFPDILASEFKRDLNAYLGAAARERADEVARRHHRLQHRPRRRGAEVRPDAARPRARRSTSATPRPTRPTSPTATAAAPPPARRSTPR